MERSEGAVIVTMRSNPVNRMNPEFFGDLHAAFDEVEQEHPALPVVLTAEGKTFSAGLDFEDVFPRFARNDMDELQAWFDRFRGSLLRVFTLPRRTVAAINGNTFAGGLILAVACDVRVGAEGRARFAINEVPVGIPMPWTYIEMVRYALGTPATAEMTLSGQLYDVAGAQRLGVLHRVVAPEQLLAAALEEARRIGVDSASAYAASKQALQQPTLAAIAAHPELDRMAMQVVMAPDSVRAQASALAALKKRG
ncbi:enoyl-CoA hydratase/isomerase family protein [Nannocystis exedens]|uniref:enoyl-CoA hydratase/isomerase family protein n=1 Tax=Nannocystis exedens TaxID=54 RepID=UPI001473618F|nr:enoyl-CoA hydratase/isomerase family protein [Nannocystis exedens]